MKNIITAVALILSFNLSAQNIVEKHFSNHLNNPEATVVQVSGKMFQYMAQVMPDEIEKDEDIPVEDAKEFLSNITSFTMVKMDAVENATSEYRRGLRQLGDEYEELVRVSDKANKVSILVQEENDVIYEIVGLVATEGEFVAASLTGTMRLDQIQDIISKIENEEMKTILRDKDINMGAMKVYPNPVSGRDNTSFQVDIPENMIGGEVRVYDLDGKLIHNQAANQTSMTLTPDFLSNGNYVVEVEKDGVSLKKKMIVID